MGWVLSCETGLIPRCRSRSVEEKASQYRIPLSVNRLMLELCGTDPTFVKFEGFEVTVTKERCSSWIDLGHFRYVGP